MTMERPELKALVREVLRARLAVPSPPEAAPRPDPSALDLVCERDVLEARRGKKRIHLATGALVTPLARETALRYGVELVRGGEGVEAAPPVRPSSIETPKPAEPPEGSCAKGVIALGSDHGGFALKESLRGFLVREAGFRVADLGCSSPDPVDYPDIAHGVAGMVARGEACRGILVDGVGIGSCMAANRHPSVRAAVGTGILEVTNAREHNNANVLCLGGRTVGDLLARALVMVFLTTAFGGGRHERRVAKIERAP